MSQGSNCFETTTFSLETIDDQSKITDNCKYPGRTVQSDQELVNYENGTIGADRQYECFCSGPNGFTVSQSPPIFQI